MWLQSSVNAETGEGPANMLTLIKENAAEKLETA